MNLQTTHFVFLLVLVCRIDADYFATISRYDIVKGDLTAEDCIVPNCTATKIWFFVHHGTRYPKPTAINVAPEMYKVQADILQNTNNKLTEATLELLKQWKLDPNFTIENASKLSPLGWNEIKLLAQRYQQLYPHLLETPYDAEKSVFQPDYFERNIKTFQAFVEGLYGEEAYMNITPLHYDTSGSIAMLFKDIVLSSDEKGWNKTEYEKFENSKEYHQVENDLSYRLGYSDPLQVRTKTMFLFCGYESALYPEAISPWCLMYTADELLVMEYRHDLEFYYERGYGNELLNDVLNVTVLAMIEDLDTKNERTAFAYFQHSTSLVLFLRALGAAKDSESLMGDNYSKMSQREWKIGELCPFAANLVAVRYDCITTTGVETKIKFLLNEKVLQLDWCSADGFCDWTTLQERFNRES